MVKLVENAVQKESITYSGSELFDMHSKGEIEKIFDSKVHLARVKLTDGLDIDCACFFEYGNEGPKKSLKYDFPKLHLTKTAPISPEASLITGKTSAAITISVDLAAVRSIRVNAANLGRIDLSQENFADRGL